MRALSVGKVLLGRASPFLEGYLEKPEVWSRCCSEELDRKLVLPSKPQKMGHSEEPWTGQKSQRLRTELRLRNRLWPCSLIGVLPTVASVAFPCNRVVLLSL